MSNVAELPIEMPENTAYGAAELKLFIKQSTYKAFIITISLLTLLLLVYFGYLSYQNIAKSAPKLAPIAKMSIEDLPPPADENADVAPPPPQEMINTGPAARAGTPVPVPDAQITADMQDFATVDVMSRASAEGGDGNDLGGFSNNIDFNDKPVKIEKREEEPSPDDFIPVEKEPSCDMNRLQKSVVYPDLARRAGIEGKVIVRVLVGSDGKLRNTKVEYSDNEMLNSAALDAIKNHGIFTPGIQNGQPILCWVSIPIVFKLR